MPKKIFTEEEKQSIIEEYTLQKVAAKKLGEKYGCSSTTLLKNLAEWGIKPNSKKLDLTNQIFGKLFICLIGNGYVFIKPIYPLAEINISLFRERKFYLFRVCF